MSRLSPGDRSNLRWNRDNALRLAQVASKEGDKARREAFAAVRKLNEYQWDSAYYVDTRPTVSEGMAKHLPRLQTSIDRLAAIADVQDKRAAERLAEAKAAQLQLDKDAGPQWVAPGLWVLFRVCLQGWLAGTGKRC